MHKTKLTVYFSIIFSALFGMVGIIEPAYAAWQPIIGIPKPEFGVNETAPDRPNPWNAAVPGYYYVCPTCPGSTDTSNTYGYPAMPRKTIPSSSVLAGSVVEIGGQYDSNATISLQGIQANPIFIRGIDYASRPKITSEITITGAYLIFENLKSGPLDAADNAFRFSVKEGADHIAIRNSEFEGNLNKSGGVAVGSWGYGEGVDSASYIVLNDLFIHDLGDINTTLDQDAHGVNVNGSVDHLWLINSELARTTGDGIQIEAQANRRDKIHHIYVGKNISHHHKQTGMWIKHATDIIFSQNTIYGHRASNSSGGGGTGFQYGPDYVWFLFNTVYDNEVGIAVASNDPPGDGTEAFYIGNLIYNIHAVTPADKYNSGAMTIRGSTNHHIVNNTFYDVDAGVNVPGGGTLNFFLANNIIANRSGLEYDFYVAGLSTITLAGSNLINNLFYSSSGPRINWGGSTYTNIGTFQTTTGRGQNNLSSDPLFVDSATNDFHIQALSPLKDSGVADVAYSVFFARYGIDIEKDIAGTTRPQGSAWDIGAYEYDTGAPPSIDTTPPSAPQGLVVN